MQMKWIWEGPLCSCCGAPERAKKMLGCGGIDWLHVRTLGGFVGWIWLKWASSYKRQFFLCLEFSQTKQQKRWGMYTACCENQCNTLRKKTSKSKYKLIIPWKGCRIKEVHGLFEATCAGSLKPLKASCLKPASPASSPEEVSLSELKDAVDAASKRGKAKGSKRKDEAHHGPPWPTWSTKDSCWLRNRLLDVASDKPDK